MNLKDKIEKVVAKVDNVIPEKHKNLLGDKWKYINAIVDSIDKYYSKRVSENKKKKKIDAEKNCPVCSQSVTIEGNITMYYVPTERIAVIKELLGLQLEASIFLQDELSKNKKDYNRCEDIAESLRDMIRKQFNVTEQS